MEPGLKMVKCPYDPNHRMLPGKLAAHILKCRQYHPHVHLIKCPFNLTHLFPEDQIELHVVNCPDRKIMLQYQSDGPDPVKGESPRPKQPVVDCEEDWDDLDCETYEPLNYAIDAPVLRQPQGINRSLRNEFRKKEKERLAELTGTSAQEVVEVKVKHESAKCEERSMARERSRSPYSSPKADHYSRFDNERYHQAQEVSESPTRTNIAYKADAGYVESPWDYVERRRKNNIGESDKPSYRSSSTNSGNAFHTVTVKSRDCDEEERVVPSPWDALPRSSSTHLKEPSRTGFHSSSTGPCDIAKKNAAILSPWDDPPRSPSTHFGPLSPSRSHSSTTRPQELAETYAVIPSPWDSARRSSTDSATVKHLVEHKANYSRRDSLPLGNLGRTPPCQEAQEPCDSNSAKRSASTHNTKYNDDEGVLYQRRRR